MKLCYNIHKFKVHATNLHIMMIFVFKNIYKFKSYCYRLHTQNSYFHDAVKYIIMKSFCNTVYHMLQKQ